jgi:DNA-binding CsgD family transcriptional regulator
MPDVTWNQPVVALCDKEGKLIWRSAVISPSQEGDFVWQHILDDQTEMAKAAFARTIALRENQVLEFDTIYGAKFRVWMWLLELSDAAICFLAISIPAQIANLTRRERDCLVLLAQGITTKRIATDLDISVSTVHTYLRRMREKLKLSNAEELISFAARFFHPFDGPISEHPNSVATHMQTMGNSLGSS